MKAARGRYVTVPPVANKMTAQTAAPLFTPMMSGDTRGLFIKDWKIAPDVAKHIPARTATVIRGNRNVLITKSYSLFRSQMAVATAFQAGIG
tara:strand:- start:419 stop:694 length:276 start_codon:yes stop_codon:yes gene_type:complete